MEELRTSLWSRLVAFYSVNKRDQLKPEVIAEIVAKYGLKEKELSARLLRKYGRPLPPSVPARDLRRVLLEFGMEDQDMAGGAGLAPVVAPPAAAAVAEAGGTGDEQDRRNPSSAARLEAQAGKSERPAERPPRGGELNFRSKFFNPLQALNHETLRPPFPRERALDNLAKFARIMPKRAATAETATTGGAVAGAGANPLSPTSSTPKNPGAPAGSHGIPQPGKSARDPAAARGCSSPTAPEPAAAQGGPTGKTSGKPDGGAIGAGGGGTRQRDPGKSGVGGSVGGHCGPTVCSAEELDRIDKEMASRRRKAELLLASGAAGPAVPDEERFNPVQRIIREYAGKGPYSLLYRLHEDKRRASVMIRRVNSIRGTCTGLIRAFDRHMNLLLVDVQEDYTAFIPARDPEPKAQERRTQRAASPNPVQAGGAGVEELGDSLRGKPAEVGDTSSARGSSAGVEGEDGKGGWGTAGGLAWSGGGSVSWGAGGGGVAEIERLSRPHGTAADGRESAFGTQELDAGGGVGGGGRDALGGDVGGADREADMPAADFNGGPRAESIAAESAGARNAVALSHLGKTQGFVETASGLGSRQLTAAFLSEEGKVGDGGQGAKGGSRQCDAQPPLGEERSSDSDRVGGVGQGSYGQRAVKGRGPGLEGGGASGTTSVKKKSSRKSRGRGPWTGELVPVRRRRFLKQLMIRGDNVVMIWESPKH
eukprot:g10894.t1